MTNTFTMRGQTSITIRHRTYTFTGSSINSGGRANILKLMDSNNKYYALKVFHQNHYQRYSIRTEQVRNSHIQNIPGLEWVTQRIMINASDDANLIQQYPLIQNAILMPWFDEQTWVSWSAIKFQISDHALQIPSQDILNRITYQLADTVTQLNDLGLAHGDINDNNVLVDIHTGKITIIDIEDMYIHSAVDVGAGGTNGYRFNQNYTAWTPDADRFATALLLSEIIALRETRALGRTRGEGYFTQDEIDTRDTHCKAYQALSSSLQNINTNLYQLFLRTWQAPDIASCPDIYEWGNAMSGFIGTTPSSQKNALSYTQTSPHSISPNSSQTINSNQQPLQDWRDAHAKTYLPRVADSNHPALIVFVLDYSNSMFSMKVNEQGQDITRAELMYNMVGALLSFLKDKSQKGSFIAPRYHIGIMAYGKTCINVLKHIDGPNVANSLDQDIMPSRHLNGIWQLPTLIQTIGGKGDAHTIASFFRSQQSTITNQIDTSDTYMTEAFNQVYSLLKSTEMIYEYDSCAAPLIVHITDGYDTDPRKNVVQMAQKIQDLQTDKGGNVLISTTYIGPQIIPPPADIKAWPGINPSTQFKDNFINVGNTLSAISSLIPDNLRKLINNYDEEIGTGFQQYNLQPGSRMLFPGNQTNMVQLSLTAASATVNINKP